MGIPAEVSWTVPRADDDVLVLQGKGPMDLSLGLAATVTEHGDQTRVVLDPGISGDPVEGPLGASVSRSIGEALQLSLDKLRERIADAVPSAAGPRAGKPVLHAASGKRLNPRTPGPR